MRPQGPEILKEQKWVKLEIPGSRWKNDQLGPQRLSLPCLSLSHQNSRVVALAMAIVMTAFIHQYIDSSNIYLVPWGLPASTSGKESAGQCRRCRFHPQGRKISWRRKWQPTLVFLPSKFRRQRSPAGCSPWDCKESDTTEWLSSYVVC